MKKIKFTKMQGLGNDFILIKEDEIIKNNIDPSQLAIKICDRNFGVGADGLVIVNPKDMQTQNTDLSWRIYNSDGTEPQMCGNAIRCFARYCYDKGLTNKKSFTVNTLAGVIKPEITDNNEIIVDMGNPILEAKEIPTSFNNNKTLLNHIVNIDNQDFKLSAISMGNPHAIIVTDEDTKDFALKHGPKIEVLNIFPEKTNVEFVKIIDKNNIKLDVWERGCGITLACGTGSCAAVVATILNKQTSNNVNVELPGGVLNIKWSGNKEDSVYMTGKAEYSFKGKFYL